MSQLEKYRGSIASKLAAAWSWLQEIVLFLLAPSNQIRWSDVWNQLLLRLCVIKSRIAVDSKERKRLLEWVSTKIKKGKPPTDFRESWRNGLALCALVEGIVKGSCPRYDLLHSEHAQENLKLGLRLIQKNIGIKPAMTVEDFMHCDEAAERKLIGLISQLKLASAKICLKSVIQRPGIILNPVTTIAAECGCIAKGMGLMLAVKGRKARFHLYLKSLSLMNVVIEIRGPENTICSERITSRSPKKRIPPKQLESEGWKKIPLEYIIQPGKVTIGYKPLVIGSHRLSIIWQGQHICGSPYIISVDDAARTVAAEPKEIKRLIVPLKRADSLEVFANKESSRSRKFNSFSFGDVRRLGNVTRKRILRRYLTVDGKEIVIEDSDVQSLAKTVKELRAKNKCDGLALNGIEGHNKSGDESSAHRNTKDEYDISSSSDAEKMITGNSDSQVIGSFSKSHKSDDSTCDLLNDAKSPSIAKASNSPESNHCLGPPRQISLQVSGSNGSEQKETALSTSHHSVPNDTKCSSLKFSHKPTEKLCATEDLSLKHSSTDILRDSQQIINSKSVPDNERNFEQKHERDNINQATESDVKTTEFMISTASSLLNSEENLDSNTQCLLDGAVESKYVEGGCMAVMPTKTTACDNSVIAASTEFKNCTQRNNSLVDYTVNKNLVFLNEKAAQSENNEPEKCDLTCEEGENLISIPENSLVKNCDELCSLRSNMLPCKHFPGSNVVVGQSDEMQFSAERSQNRCKETRETERSKDHIDASSENSIVNYDQQIYSTEEILMKSESINVKMEEASAREVCSENFQSNIPINLDDCCVISEISVKEITCGSGNELILVHQSSEISREKEDEKDSNNQKNDKNNSIGGDEIPTHRGTEQQGNNKKEELEINQNSCKRKGFILETLDEDFTLIESSCTDVAVNSETSKFRNVSLIESITTYDSRISAVSSDNGNLSNKDSLERNLDERFISQELSSDAKAVVGRKLSSTNTDSSLDVVGKLSEYECLGLQHSKELTEVSVTLNQRVAIGELEELKESAVLNASIETLSPSSPKNLVLSKSSIMWEDAEQQSSITSGDDKSCNFTTNSSDKCLSYGGVNLRKVSDRRTKCSGEDIRRKGILFDKCTRHVEEPNSDSLNTFMQSVMSSHDLSNHTGSCNTFIDKNLKESLFNCDNSVQKKVKEEPPCKTSNSNFGKPEFQSLTQTQASKELTEVSVALNQRVAIGELEELKESSVLNTSIETHCPSSPKNLVLSKSSIMWEDAEQQSNITSEDGKSCDYDEEEEFPFSAMVKAKKEYWEKMLEEKSCKQVPKICYLSRQDCTNVDNLKNFWQDVAKGRTNFLATQSSSSGK